jgi:NAD(P)-dependent dehydrogenase (short-subunit alcohol dehydrogenase family)
MRFVISGGNSGIGLEAGRQLVAQGHDVVLLGRDAKKGEAAVLALGAKASFLACDLSTHMGVREAAQKIDGEIDGLLLAAGVLFMGDARTADGLHPIFAVNYLGRYHLAQLLLPRVKSTVVFIVAGVPLNAPSNLQLFERNAKFPGFSSLRSIQIANYHYAAYLAKEHPKLRVGVCNVGLVKTDIMRAMPAPMRFMFTLTAPLITVSVERAAANPVWLSTHTDWTSGTYWSKPGELEKGKQTLRFDPGDTERQVAASKALTGA